MFARKLISSLTSSKCSSSSIQSIRLLSEKTPFDAKPMIAVLQLNSTSDREANHRASERLIRQAASYRCSMAFLPENFDSVVISKKQVTASLEPIDGPMINRYRDLARSLNIWLSLGGFHEKPEHIDDGRKYNTHLMINNEGDIVSVYRKIHPFDGSWGRSMVADPRGCIIAQVGEDVGLAVAVIDPEVQRQARILLPNVNDRRPDIYGEIITAKAKQN